MPLFKYARPDRVDVLINGTIRFSPFSEFNDPFEGLPDTAIVTHPEFVAEMKESVVRDIVFQSTIEAVAGGHAPRISIKLAKEMFDLRYPHGVADIKGKAMELLKGPVSGFRVLSLSRVAPSEPSSLLLWGHYTESHTGLVFEFDDTHPWITHHVLNAERTIDSSDVTYVYKRPEWTPGAIGREFYLSKSSHWGYEREFRLVRPAGADNLDATKVDSLATWPPELLLSVTVGVNATNETLAAVLSALKSRKEFGHVKVWKAKVHHDEYRVENVLIPR